MAIIQANAKLYVWSRMFPKVLKFDDFSKVIQSSTINMQSAFGASATIRRIKYAALTLTPNARASVTASAIANPKRLTPTTLRVESFLEIRLPTKMSINYAMLGIDLVTAKNVTLTMEEGFVREQGTGLPVPGRSLASIKSSVKAEASFVPAQASLSSVISVKYTNNAAVMAASGGFTVSAKLNAAGVTDAQSQFVFGALVGVIKPYSAEVTSNSDIGLVTDIIRNVDSDLSTVSLLSTDFDIVQVTDVVLETTATFDIETLRERNVDIALLTESTMTIDAVKTVSNISSLTSQFQQVTNSTRLKLYASSISSTMSLSVPIIDTPLVFEYVAAGPQQLGIVLTAPVNAVIEWGDGTQDTYTTGGTKYHNYTYNADALRLITVRGTLNQLSFETGSVIGNISTPTGGIKSCKSFGDLGLTRISFAGCGFLTEVPPKLPGSITSTSQMFNFCYNFNDNRVIQWNMSNVTNTSSMFADTNYFNQPIGSWNMSNVTSTSGMFSNADNFNQPIGSWNMSNVTNANRMFRGAVTFNQPLNSWSTGSIKSMLEMFRSAREFNQPLDQWDVTGVDLAPTPESNSMIGMFAFAEDFNQDISSWCVALIPTEPSEFDLGTNPLWTDDKKPNWGAPC
jgi:hypothetical protein